MENLSISEALPTAADWAKSLTNVASHAKQMGVGFSRIHYDRETKELTLFKANNPTMANRYEELNLDSLKSRTIAILSSTPDMEVKYRSVKALLKLMGAKRMDPSTLQELTQVSLHAAQGLSPAKAQKIRLLLDSAKRSIPSEQGGTGVHFLEVDAPQSEDPNVRIRYGIYKFVPNPRQVLFANSILKSLGFVVPKTRMILRDSPEGKRAIELFKASCPDKIIPQRGHILVMDRMRAHPLNRTKKADVIELLQQKQWIHNLGRMVMIDLCIGNIDRWNQGRCAPGNIMISDKEPPELVLIDHESRMENSDPEQLKQQIHLLMKGDAALQLFSVMSESLDREWKKMGDNSATAQIPSLEQIHVFHEGLLEGAKQLIMLFPHKEALDSFSNRIHVGNDRVDTNQLWKIIEFLQLEIGKSREKI